MIATLLHRLARLIDGRPYMIVPARPRDDD